MRSRIGPILVVLGLGTTVVLVLPLLLQVNGLRSDLDAVLDRITALDERVSDICNGVPVC